MVATNEAVLELKAVVALGVASGIALTQAYPMFKTQDAQDMPNVKV